LSTNLYRPTDDPEPELATFGNVLSDPRTTAIVKLTSVALADTLSFIDGAAQLTLGVRRQRFDIRNFAYTSGVESQPYDRSRTSPAIGAVLKLGPGLSVYANYIQSLAQGDTAPGTAANFGSQLAPYVSRQEEVGVKADWGRVAGTMALFSTVRPRAVLDADNNFGSAGEDRHRGVELSLFGKPMPSLRLVGGLTALDARQLSTGSASTDGKRVIGVPQFQENLDLEWDTPFCAGLSANARVISTGKVHANATNTLSVPGWTRFDAGVRYAVPLAGQLVTWRARVDNVASRRYWASSGGSPGSGYLVLGRPRTLTASATISF
jgi:iron complex outermembrane receptor protein